MVSERDRGTAHLLCRRVQRAAPHLGAERAGIFLPADVEDDLADLGRNHAVFDRQAAAELLDLAVVRAGKAEIDRDGAKRERLRIKPPQLGKCDEQGERILAGGDADADFVPCADHLIFVRRAADITQNSLQFFHVLENSAPAYNCCESKR